MNDATKALKKLDEQLSALTFCESLIFWDAATLAPDKAVSLRSTALTELSELYYNLFVNENTQDIIKTLETERAGLSDLERARLDFFKESYEKIACVPVAEYAAFKGLQTKSSKAWEEAKATCDFSIFEPYLQQVIDFNRKYITYRNKGGHPYNTLLDDYERGLTVDVADRFFEELREVIVPLVKSIGDRNKSVASPFDGKTFSIEGQKAFSNRLLKLLDFDMDSGVIAESVHPFTMNITRDDVRVTTHYSDNNLLSSVYSTIHECGHGLYEQHISEDIGFSKLATGTTMGIHESQSRIYENNIGRSLPFWEANFHELAHQFPEELAGVTPMDCYEACNKVAPSLIRIEADELTYSLHIMVRYELEKKIFEGSLNAKDLPAAWNDLYEAYLGIRPKHDGEGVLQDVHWSEGLFGYFPSYALGSAYAAQFEAAMDKEFSVTDTIRSGDLSPINKWLKDHIHQYGSTKTPEDLIKASTKEDFDPSYFTQYLVKKFKSLYDLA